MIEFRGSAVPRERIGVEMIGVAAGSAVDLDLRLESVSEGVLVTGTVDAPTSGECARCLAPLAGTVSVYLTELFAYPGSTTEATTEDDEVRHVEDDHIDLLQTVVDAIGLELPLAPTCDTVAGRECLHDETPAPDAVEGEEHTLPDPRWAGLLDKLGTPDGDGRVEN